MQKISMVAKHAKGKSEQDRIFGVNSAANKKAEIVGKENIVNASIGAFLDASGKLITLPTVEETMKNLSFDDLAAYAPIAGLPGYIEAAIDATFEDCKPDAFIKGIATPGGSGGVHHAVWNYTDEGDTFLTADWFWGPYRTMAQDLLRNIDTFLTFDEEGNFNLKACMEKVEALAKVQKNVLLIINSPAHNPTGYSLTDDEWEKLVASLSELANKKENNIVLYVDVAYLDFAPKESREFFKTFSNLPENLLVLVGFSMSKGYTMYGYRTGCLIGVSSSEDVINEFFDVNQFSSRATWSNCTRSGMRVLMELHDKPELMAKVKKEREEYRLSMEDRAHTFINEANEVGLKMCPYHSGFFITIPTQNADEIALKLQDDNIFLVSLKKGIRIAICAIPSEKIEGMATKIKKAMDEIGE